MVVAIISDNGESNVDRVLASTSMEVDPLILFERVVYLIVVSVETQASLLERKDTILVKHFLLIHFSDNAADDSD